MLGERIREIRKRNQMNQTEFSQFIGVSQGTLSELEQNKYNPSLETILAIISVFRIDATLFLFGNEANEDGIIEISGEINMLDNSLIKKFSMLSTRDQMEIVDIIELKNAKKND
ncbi:helix-turn-helix domain-containing protein [Brevibacillus sp. SIMBA_040]|uniref:helix-turn-helix domain-containing protein n=1 Tax=unclassified Brevibacillus TaxID=2684853 RepID=UPI003978D880